MPAALTAISQDGDGLVKWTSENRQIENKDVVFRYTFGHTHLPRPEDYPVMPTAYFGFTLKREPGQANCCAWTMRALIARNATGALAKRGS